MKFICNFINQNRKLNMLSEEQRQTGTDLIFPHPVTIARWAKSITTTIFYLNVQLHKLTGDPFLLSKVESIEFYEAYQRSSCLRFSGKCCHTSIFHPVRTYSTLHSKYVLHGSSDMHVNVFHHPSLFHIPVYVYFRVQDFYRMTDFSNFSGISFDLSLPPSRSRDR